MKKIRFGIIGIGNQGSHYALTFFAEGKIKNGYISAFCDSNPAKLENMKEKWQGEVKYFLDYKELISSGLCDAIIITTPHYQHPEIAIAALEAGIGVITDKPAGVYTKQVREMNEAAERTKTPFAVLFNQRTNCVYRKMREIIAEGGIGDLQRVNWTITDWFRTQHYYDSGSWRATWRGEGGGVLINQCPHQLDLVSWVVGKMPSRVRGFCQYGRWHDVEVEDEVTAFLEYENGATGVFITTTGEAPGTNRLEISGTRGMLTCENDRLTFKKLGEDSLAWSKTCQGGFKKPPMETIEVQTDGKNEQHAGIINNFANSLLGLEELFVDGKEGINGVELMNAIELSGWRGGAPVSIPVDEEEYLRELNEKCKNSRHKTANDDAVLDNSASFGIYTK